MEHRLLIRGDVDAVEPELPVVDPGVGVLELDLAVPQGFDLAADEDDPRLVGVDDVEVVAGALVLGDR